MVPWYLGNGRVVDLIGMIRFKFGLKQYPKPFIRKNFLLLERNNLFQMDLIDLKVKFADLVSLVQARKTTNWIKGYEQIIIFSCAHLM